MKDKACLDKLQAEIDDFESSGLLGKPHIKYSEAIKMPYLVACCKEAMRLHPSVGLGMPRHVPAGGATIAGRYFPAGSRVSMNPAVVHYDQSIFGSDSGVFNPERWLDGDAALMDRHMLQFGGGSRTCLGKNVRSDCSNAQMLSSNTDRYPLLRCTSLCHNFSENSISNS